MSDHRRGWCWVGLWLLGSGCVFDLGVTDRDLDGFSTIYDCDDDDPAVHPDAHESCNGRDDDCDGLVDEDAAELSTWYLDQDGDGYGRASLFVRACSCPAGFVDRVGDCDDQDPRVHPHATETCDGEDDDCDGDIDEGAPGGRNSWYPDDDDDGYGDQQRGLQACASPSSRYIERGGDCDDLGEHAAVTYPGAAWRDSDSACMQDADGDGWGEQRPANPEVTPGSDCDDTSAWAHVTFPGSAALEDEALCTKDQDGDGYGDDLPAAPGVDPGLDCCDACTFNWQTYPGAAALEPEGACMTDHDGDGYGDADPAGPRVERGQDCDDGDAAVNPEGEEVCDEADNDCDGEADEGLNFPAWPDDDRDGYGDPERIKWICALTSDLVEDDSDCDDSEATAYPGAPELCDDLDNDCDGVVDEDQTWETLYEDNDGDGYGDPALPRTVCTPGSGLVEDDSDCDDGDAVVYPGAPELCDLLDNDCDGEVDEELAWVDLYEDADGDGYGNPAVTMVGCLPSGGWVMDDSDCDDTRSSVNPSRREVDCNGLDDDCDGVIECGDISSMGVVYDGPSSGDMAGWSVAGVGDVDGDGYADLLVGASLDGHVGTGAGAAYLVLGQATPLSCSLTAADASYHAEAAGDFAGDSVAGVGDVDGDGFDDLLIGASLADSSATQTGAAYLVLGSASPAGLGLGSAAARYGGEAYSDRAGAALAGVGDVNGDGLADLLVGAPYYDTTVSETGAAYLVLGSASPASMDLGGASAIYEGAGAWNLAGSALAGGGDVDGDGLDDLIIGAFANDDVASNAGAAYLVLGSASPGDLRLSRADAIFTGEAYWDYAGVSVAIAGDVDGDGLEDLLVGASGNDSAGSSAGAAYLVLGCAVPVDLSLVAAAARYTGISAGDEAGSVVTGAGDVDGDGLDDFLVSAPDATVDSTADGEIYLLLGAVTPASASLGSAAWDAYGESSRDYAGSSLAGLGDVDGDGLDDFLVGAYGNDTAGSSAGRAYLVLSIE